MFLVCTCGNVEETEKAPGIEPSKGWYLSAFEYPTDRQETNENPLLPGIVRAFCSQECEHKLRDEYYKNKPLISSKL